jgi:hypothetical protein
MRFTYKLLSIPTRDIPAPVEISLFAEDKNEADKRVIEVIDYIFTIPTGEEPGVHLIKIEVEA